MIQKNKFIVISLFIVIILVAVFKIYQYISRPYISIENEQKIDIIIPKGASVYQIADTLYKKNLIDNKKMLNVSKFNNNWIQLKGGTIDCDQP